MCTLIVLDRVVPHVPLVVASNRDEYLSRPAAPPALVRAEGREGIPRVAPQDLEAGGTWMGVNARGLFVGLTNMPSTTGDRNRRSRGKLVMDALGYEDAEKSLQHVRSESPDRYNPCHLLLADGERAYAVSLSGEGLEIDRLRPGIHVLTNRPGDPKELHIREALAGVEESLEVEGVLERLRSVLRSHGPAAEATKGVCVHTPEYGTRSSALLTLGEPRWRFWQAEGPPCEAKYRNYSRLLDELRQA